MKVVVVQPVITHYDLDFWNAVILEKDVESLVVFADLKKNSLLNKFDESNCNFKVEHLPEKKFMGLVIRPGLLSKLKKYKSYEVVFNSSPREITQVFSMFIRKMLRKKNYSWGMFHSIGPSDFFRSTIFKTYAILSDNCLVYSKRGALHLSSLGIPASKISIVGTALNTTNIQNLRNEFTNFDLDVFKKKHGLINKKVVLLVVRLSKIKRLNLLIDAAAKVIQSDSDYNFVLIGDGEDKEELQRQVLNFGLENSIHFKGAIYDEIELAPWFLISDIFAIPTCIGLSAHHSLAYGLPIITDDSLTTQASEVDVLFQGYNCCFYSEGDTADFAKNIESFTNEVIKNKEYYKKNCMNTVDKTFTFQNKVKSFIYAIK